MSQLPPMFTVVIPTYDRPRQLANCLSAMAEIDYPRDRFQVIVVDDESPEAPEEVIDAFRDRLDLTLIVQPHGGPAIARNTGAARARGEFLAFTDDDCTPAPDWLWRFAARFADAPDHAIGGRVINRLPDNVYSTASQALVDYLYAYFSSRQGRFFTSNNLAVATARFRAIGGFHISIPLPAAEDREFCIRWVRHGQPLLYAHEAVIHHAHVLDFSRFWRQHFNYGRGAYYFRKLVRQESDERVRLEPLTFYSNLLLFPLARRKAPHAVWVSLLLGISQVANASGFFYEKARPCSKTGEPRMKERLA
jgi:glycosyltransferase involved in cell wall biosynthesis